MQAIGDWFQRLYETTGLNFSVFYDAYDWDRYFAGLKMTLLLSVTTILLSLVIGAVGAWLQGSPSTLLRLLVNAFVVLFRNTPPLVQLYFFYFGARHHAAGRRRRHGMRVPLVSNVTLGDHLAVVLRGRVQRRDLPLRHRGGAARRRSRRPKRSATAGCKAYVHVVLPLAFRISLPALNNNLVNLVKTTTLAYAIAVPEMLYVVEPDLVGRAERAGDDERAARRLRASWSACSSG